MPHSGLEQGFFVCLDVEVRACVVLLMHVGCAFQRFADAGTNIFRADVAREFRLLHELGGLFSCSAEKQRSARGVKLIGEVAYGTETRGIDGGHISESQDHHGGQGTQAVKNISEFIGRAE